MITITNDLALELLEKRLKEALEMWSNPAYFDLFYSMYERMFDDDYYFSNFDPSEIVDNDIINYCKVIEKDDEDYKKIKELYDNGEYDVSEYRFEYYRTISYIEAYDQDLEAFLIRL